MRDLRKELSREAAQHPPSWKLADGAVVVGAIASYHKVDTERGPAWVCTIHDDRCGPVAVWLTPVGLATRFSQLKPAVGERVGVKCLGKHPQKGYWQFKVLVDRPDELPEWAALAAEGEDEDTPF